MMHILDNCPPEYDEVALKLKCSFYVDNCLVGVSDINEQERFIEQSKLIMVRGCFNLRGFESNVAGRNIDTDPFAPDRVSVRVPFESLNRFGRSIVFERCRKDVDGTIHVWSKSCHSPGTCGFFVF